MILMLKLHNVFSYLNTESILNFHLFIFNRAYVNFMLFSNIHFHACEALYLAIRTLPAYLLMTIKAFIAYYLSTAHILVFAVKLELIEHKEETSRETIEFRLQCKARGADIFRFKLVTDTLLAEVMFASSALFRFFKEL